MQWWYPGSTTKTSIHSVSAPTITEMSAVTLFYAARSVSIVASALVGQAEAFLRIVSEGPLDLIVAAHANRCVDIEVASVKEVVARAVDSVTLACELRVRRTLNRPCTKLRPEGAAKLFSREQPLILDTSI